MPLGGPAWFPWFILAVGLIFGSWVAWAVHSFVRIRPERKGFESQPLQAEKLKTIGVLAKGLAHELNNELTPVLAYLDIYIRQNKDKDLSILSEAQQAAMRCAEIIKKINRFNQPILEKKSVIQVGRILDEIKILLPIIFSSEVECEITWDEDLWLILGNDREIEMALVNLMVNARDARKGKTEQFFIEARNLDLSHQKTKAGQKAGRCICLKVRDIGTGIDPRGGWGPDLRMILNIVTSHQGWIDLASRPGEGNSFRIYLPAVPEALTNS